MISLRSTLALVLLAGFAVARADDAPALNTRGPEPREVSLGGQEFKLADYTVPGVTTCLLYTSKRFADDRDAFPLGHQRRVKINIPTWSIAKGAFFYQSREQRTHRFRVPVGIEFRKLFDNLKCGDGMLLPNNPHNFPLRITDFGGRFHLRAIQPVVG